MNFYWICRKTVSFKAGQKQYWFLAHTSQPMRSSSIQQHAECIFETIKCFYWDAMKINLRAKTPAPIYTRPEMAEIALNRFFRSRRNATYNITRQNTQLVLPWFFPFDTDKSIGRQSHANSTPSLFTSERSVNQWVWWLFFDIEMLQQFQIERPLNVHAHFPACHSALCRATK